MMSGDANTGKRKRGRVIRTGHALPNAAEHDMAKSRLERTTAQYAGRAAPVRQDPQPEAPAPPETRAETAAPAKPKPRRKAAPDSAPARKPAPKAGAGRQEAAPQPPAETKRAKKNIRGFVVWLPVDIARMKTVAEHLGTSLGYLEKALMKKASARYLGLERATALKESRRLRAHLDLTRADGAGGIFVNAFSDPDIVRALRSDIRDPLDLIADARIIGALFRHYGLEILDGYEKDIPQ